MFGGTVIGFLVSAALVVSVVLPSTKPSQPRGIYDRTTRGIRIYLATPRLRGLLALNLAVASAGALVIVNTVVYVQAAFGLDHQATALALAAFGGATLGLPVTAIILATLAAVAIGISFAVWSSEDPEIVDHSHHDLPADPPHLSRAGYGRRHAHTYVIDDLHLAWPRER